MSAVPSAADLGRLISEARNPRSTEIDLMSSAEVLSLINAEDQGVADAVCSELPAIARAVDAAVEAFRAGGRLIYIGAGTSGRLGVLDASECPPTFSVAPDMVIGIIAGGDTALRNAVEGAEDSEAGGAADIAAHDVTARDVVVGIAVSGHTPYTIGAVDEARRRGATTVSLTCNPGSVLAERAQISIAPVVGPEVITGSTRMKSGSAHKMVLNMLSSGAMIRIGKTYRNLMVDLSISNNKLRSRAIGMVADTTGVSRAEAEDLLARTGGEVKLAICMQLTGLDADAARLKLDAAKGVLRQAIGQVPTASEVK
jgi:N-acetylmuramic acid 6-phosphate etherase